MQRPAAPGGAGLEPYSFEAIRSRKKKATRPSAGWLFLGPREAHGNPHYLVPPLAGVPGAVEPEFETAALDSGVGMGLVLLELEPDEPVEPPLVEGVDGVEGVEDVAPVSSTFFPQAPSASRAARARAVAAAGLNLDACMSVPFMKNEK